MRDEILQFIDHPAKLEEMYRGNKGSFEQEFLNVYPELKGNKVAEVWFERLTYKTSKPNKKGLFGFDLLVVLCIGFVLGIWIKWPKIMSFDPDSMWFFQRNMALIIFSGLILYSAYKQKLLTSLKFIPVLVVFLITALYINLIPHSAGDSQVEILILLHVPFLLWGLYGQIFTGLEYRNPEKRMQFVRFNGDLSVLIAVIILAGGLLSAVTIELFHVINIDIETFWGQYVFMIGIVLVPTFASFVLEKYPEITAKVSPFIATVFSPIVLITLTIYLASILMTGKDPYNDRDFLLVFNIMLISVIALIIFSISENDFITSKKFNLYILFGLTLLSLIINAIALSAIVYRLNEYGFTPNRVSVLGTNVLFLINLVLISYDFIQIFRKKKQSHTIDVTIANYLPVYLVWILFIVFVLPFIFGF